MFNSKLAFTNTQDKNITRECIENFAKSTKYFTNGGFAKLIMQKKYIKDIFELCLDAYENDLSKAKFDTPLIFIDKEKLTFKFEKLPDAEKYAREHGFSIDFIDWPDLNAIREDWAFQKKIEQKY